MCIKASPEWTQFLKDKSLLLSFLRLGASFLPKAPLSHTVD